MIVILQGNSITKSKINDYEKITFSGIYVAN